MIQPTFGGVGNHVPARSVSATWPETVNDYPQPANGTVVNFPGVINDSGVRFGTTSQSKTGTGNVTHGTGTGYRGRAVFVYAAGAAGTCRQMIQQFDMTVPTEQGGEADASYLDDHAVKRCVIFAAFEPAGLSALGFGFHFAAQNVGNSDIMGGAMGFGWQRSAAGVVSVVSRQALGVGAVITHATYAPLNGATDLQKFNAYETIAIGARNGADPIVKFKVNGALIATKKIGSAADAGMPTNALSSAGPFGWGLAILCLNNTNQLAVSRIRYMVGPTEQSVMGR